MESERDELQEELTQFSSKVNLSGDEKKRLETRIATLEDDIEEKETENEVIMLFFRK